MQGKAWYWAAATVLIAGYAVGGIAPVAVYYFGWLAGVLPPSFIPVLLSFLLGLLGANVQLSIFFAKDVNDVISGKQGAVPPSCFDFFGYFLKQVWGGLAAVFFVESVRLGFLAAVSTSGEMTIPAIVVISFTAGLRAYQILKVLAGIVPPKSVPGG